MSMAGCFDEVIFRLDRSVQLLFPDGRVRTETRQGRCALDKAGLSALTLVSDEEYDPHGRVIVRMIGETV
ncbi:MAG: hypothetical protein OI74_10930 [Gammaproteobacteria bacterium (ex Lamellibrachia satsuma)]|nr:MAG: hypothetical protein OI74_10930 [Gammaproteobacteria bacterium (ex Lamellibrachia satsuma)]RRS36738.1 MAG: hypothetical protein NV67_05395 [Gammaproteobacteria bacterium (ex Lamellibrachia satsuma)]